MKKRSVINIKIFLFLMVLIGASLACNYKNQDAIQLIAKAAMEKCFTVNRDQYERSAAELGQTPETPKYPDSAIYEVCQIQGQPSSVRMIDGKNTADQVSEDKNKIPVGTYKPLKNAEPPPSKKDVWDYFETDFTITVADDGTVTGFRIYKYWVDSSIPGCAARDGQDLTTNVNGFLEGNQGTVTLEYKNYSYREFSGEECGEGIHIFRDDEETAVDVTIIVTGNQMDIIHPNGQSIFGPLIKE